MKLAMKGFLLAECNRLLNPGARTTSLKKLYLAAAAPSGARAREYVFLLALEMGKMAMLQSLARKDGRSAFSRQCRALTPQAMPYEGDAERMLEERGDRLGKRFQQVLVAFREPEARKLNDAHVKDLLRDKTLEAMRVAGITAYKVIRDLNLNKGNAYAFLRGDSSKISRSTARRMYDHVLAIQQRPE